MCNIAFAYKKITDPLSVAGGGGEIESRDESNGGGGAGESWDEERIEKILGVLEEAGRDYYVDEPDVK